jgi:hypothetical protein
MEQQVLGVFKDHRVLEELKDLTVVQRDLRVTKDLLVLKVTKV